MKTLHNIQRALVAPKNERNNFGNYAYRTCEGILAALKPLLEAENAVVTLNDEVVAIGERIYVKATATLTSDEGTTSTSAYAREAQTKKGMDESQITGMASSYARKTAGKMLTRWTTAPSHRRSRRRNPTPRRPVRWNNNG